jgi:hypothetical protein
MSLRQVVLTEARSSWQYVSEDLIWYYTLNFIEATITEKNIFGEQREKPAVQPVFFTCMYKGGAMPILTVQNKQFTAGNSLPGGHITPVPNGALAHESAATLALPDPNNPGEYDTYVFLFWNISGASNSGIHSTADVDIHISTNDVAATAWYVKAGGGNSWTGVYTYAFSESQDQFLTDIPIASVSPAAAWTPGNQKVETDAQVAPSGVDITADPNIGGEDFDLWLTFSGGTVLGPVLHADANTAIWAAIAHYKVPEDVTPGFDYGLLHLIEEWQEIRNKLLLVADPSPEDLWRIQKLLDKSRIQEALGQEDELSRVVDTLDQMTEVQVRGSLAAIRAQQVRLKAASRMLEKSLRKNKK